jgi:arginine decarboxylase-like protein
VENHANRAVTTAPVSVCSEDNDPLIPEICNIHSHLDWRIDQSRKIYGIRGWRSGFFDINAAGEVQVMPNGRHGRAVSLRALIDQAQLLDISLPMVLRTPQIEQYAFCVVQEIKRHCDLNGLQHPAIFSESGSALTAHHGVVFTCVLEDEKSADELCADSYIFHFSLFQSIPDSWALGQVFPVMPTSKLALAPTRQGIVHDITCDSDGMIGKYVGANGVCDSLPMHDIVPAASIYSRLHFAGYDAQKVVARIEEKLTHTGKAKRRFKDAFNIHESSYLKTQSAITFPDLRNPSGSAA